MTTPHHSAGQAAVAVNIEIPVIGMSCGGCAQHIQQALSELQGVMQATVSHTEAKAHIRYAPEQVTVQQIIKAIIKAGYQAGEPLATDKTTHPHQQQANRPCCCAKKNNSTERGDE
ncbi:MAG TPA: heavy metal-associated domain-containing protein [Novimethylophilus sp.]|jgi:Cu+-exporting ATPase|uniref:heavy-metal-associated domain-containing protein n=1 Tax=Novimethylophilus sp. TaxID=2137426 RepID=UPI002F413D46